MGARAADPGGTGMKTNPEPTASEDRGSSRPRIMVEALAAKNDSGLGKHVRMFVEALAASADAADFIFILPPGYAPSLPGITLRPRFFSWKLFTWLQFPLAITRFKPDQVFCLGQSLPPFRPRRPRYLQLIPDMGPLEPSLQFRASLHNPYNRRWLAHRAPQADVLVTSTRFTASRIESLLRYPRNSIRVIRPIHPHHFNGVAKKVGGSNLPDAPYFLAVGNLEPRKNFGGLISAYALLRSRKKGVPPLYLVGNKAWGHAEIAAKIADLGLTGSVFLTGHVSESNLKNYYRNCRVFISSSLYEGWGYPLFEALLHGAPSLYHAGSAQEEFAQGLALGVDCGDPEALSTGLETLWRSEDVRAKLEKAMAERFPRIARYDLASALRNCLGLPKS